jgi:dTDP-4-dehydrorhamnose reductase
MTRYLVIGANGQLGREFRKLLDPADVVALGHEDILVESLSSVQRGIGAHGGIDVVVNLAAFHRVDDCEVEADRAFSVNAVGALNVARAAREIGASTVFLSSDYVFGQPGRSVPFTEDDAPSPVNVYGASKAAGEHLVRIAGPRHLIVRTSSLYGATTSRKGWTFPELMIQKAREGQPLKVVGDQTMCPTYAPNLAATIRRLLEAGQTGTFHVAGHGEVTWYDFARAALEIAGIEYPVERVSSAHFAARAARPAYSALASRHLPPELSEMRPWREELETFLAEKGYLT